MPFASSCVLREDFYSPRTVQDNRGVVVASTIDRGIVPTSVAARVTYDGTQRIGHYATELTVRARIRAGTARAALCPLISKCNGPTPDNQWILLVTTTNLVAFYVATASGDFANVLTSNNPLVVGNEYIIHATYKGSLAAANRATMYWNGQVVPTTINGTIPTSMRSNAVPITVWNYDGSTTLSPSADYKMFDAAVFSRWMDASEVADDYADLTYREVVP